MYPDPLPEGFRLSQGYTVIELIAQTALSSVYLAEEDRTLRPVVLKRLSADPAPGGALHQTVLTNMVREKSLLASLHHPQLPRLHDAFRRGRDYFLVLDFIPGPTLQQALRRPIAAERAFAIADKLCTVVQVLHSHQPPIIHADIKPDNIILCGQRVVLIDLGLARSLHPLLNVAVGMGSRHYAPPEQVRGELLDQRADIFALGMVLDELLADIQDDRLADLLASMTAFDPRDRPRTVCAVRRALRLIAACWLVSPGALLGALWPSGC